MTKVMKIKHVIFILIMFILLLSCTEAETGFSEYIIIDKIRVRTFLGEYCKIISQNIETEEMFSVAGALEIFYAVEIGERIMWDMSTNEWYRKE